MVLSFQQRQNNLRELDYLTRCSWGSSFSLNLVRPRVLASFPFFLTNKLWKKRSARPSGSQKFTCLGYRSTFMHTM